MVHRSLASLMRIALATGGLSLVLWGCMAATSFRSTGAGAVRSYAPLTPPITAVQNDGLEIVWAFEVGDLMACDGGPALALRHLQREFGPRVRLTMIAIGEDPHIIQPFLKRERLDAEVVRLSRRAFVRRFADSPLPSIRLVQRGVTLATARDTAWIDGVPLRTLGIEEAARTFLD